jgi:hypothetical protein
MPRPRCTDFVHDKKVMDERPFGGKPNPLPHVAESDPVIEGPMYKMLRKMMQWKKSQDLISQTLLAKQWFCRERRDHVSGRPPPDARRGAMGHLS